MNDENSEVVYGCVPTAFPRVPSWLQILFFLQAIKKKKKKKNFDKGNVTFSLQKLTSTDLFARIGLSDFRSNLTFF
jgi:hypothetical protein